MDKLARASKALATSGLRVRKLKQLALHVAPLALLAVAAAPASAITSTSSEIYINSSPSSGFGVSYNPTTHVTSLYGSAVSMTGSGGINVMDLIWRATYVGPVPNVSDVSWAFTFYGSGQINWQLDAQPGGKPQFLLGSGNFNITNASKDFSGSTMVAVPPGNFTIELTAQGQEPFSIYVPSGFTIDIQDPVALGSVPEPSSFALLLSAVGLGCLARRRKN